MGTMIKRGLFLALPASALLVVAGVQMLCTEVDGFYTTPLPSSPVRPLGLRSIPPSSTALQVWWFGGTENSETNQEGDSCELVAVRIERTSPNSRKIAGSIAIPARLMDVWAILTDYNRLTTHVPNLVESRITSRQSNGEPGDGTFRCKLFQKGAQKIVGFEFGASLTMAMSERIVAAGDDGNSLQERVIGFECIDSFFFTEFDGEWRAKEQMNENGELDTLLTYVVDVRPKGPVPVAALEWRIREDVPTNLRAVKKAAIGLASQRVHAAKNGVRMNDMQTRTETSNGNDLVANKGKSPQSQNLSRSETNAIRRAAIRYQAPARSSTFGGRSRKQITSNGADKTRTIVPVPPIARSTRNLQKVGAESTRNTQSKNKAPLPFKVTWDADETMAAYLRE